MKAQQRTETDSLVPQRTSRRAILGLALGGLALLAGLEVTAAKPKRRLKNKAKQGGKAKSNAKLSASAKRRQPRKPKFKTVTRVFTNASPISISATREAANPFPSKLNVAGFKQGKLLDLNVTLSGFSHTYPGDVDVLLVAPNGSSAVIFSDLGGSTDVSNLTFVLDDQTGAILPPLGQQLGSGTFKPTNEDLADTFPSPAPYSTSNTALATFNGINPNGSWRLFVADDFSTADGGSLDGGSFAGWSLTIKARVRV